jgi:hypothetical protein
MNTLKNFIRIGNNIKYFRKEKRQISFHSGVDPIPASICDSKKGNEGTEIETKINLIIH